MPPPVCENYSWQRTITGPDANIDAAYRRDHLSMRLRVLVIGSQGLLGRILCKQLAEDYDVYGLDI